MGIGWRGMYSWADPGPGVPGRGPGAGLGTWEGGRARPARGLCGPGGPGTWCLLLVTFSGLGLQGRLRAEGPGPWWPLPQLPMSRRACGVSRPGVVGADLMSLTLPPALTFGAQKVSSRAPAAECTHAYTHAYTHTQLKRIRLKTSTRLFS